MAPGFAGKQNVKTYTVGFGLGTSNAGAVKLLQETAKQGDLENPDAHAFLAENAGDLSSAERDHRFHCGGQQLLCGAGGAGEPGKQDL